MSPTHVCIISEQPIPNLLPLLVERPEQVVFLVSPEMKAQADRLQRLLLPRGIKVSTKEIPAYDFAAVAASCEEIENELQATNAELVLNVTGGTKIAALAAFQVFFFNDRRVIYLDTFNNQLLQLAPEPTTTPLQGNHLRVKDYLTAYGMNPLANAISGNEDRRPALQEVAELLINDDGLLSQFNSSIDRHSNNRQSITLSLNELGNNAEKLAAVLTKSRAAEWTSSTTLRITSPKNIFFCHGGWLEEYVYWSIRDLNIKNLDLARNVRVEWDGKGKQPTENEFDALFTHENRLHIISCKTSNPDRETSAGNKATETLNELDALKDRAGGLFGRPMLVSARKLRDADRERARKMNIKLVDGQEVLRLKEHCKSWLSPRQPD